MPIGSLASALQANRSPSPTSSNAKRKLLSNLMDNVSAWASSVTDVIISQNTNSSDGVSPVRVGNGLAIRTLHAAFVAAAAEQDNLSDDERHDPEKWFGRIAEPAPASSAASQANNMPVNRWVSAEQAFSCLEFGAAVQIARLPASQSVSVAHVLTSFLIGSAIRDAEELAGVQVGSSLRQFPSIARVLANMDPNILSAASSSN